MYEKFNGSTHLYPMRKCYHAACSWRVGSVSTSIGRDCRGRHDADVDVAWEVGYGDVVPVVLWIVYDLSITALLIGIEKVKRE
jgi:hypothetical protein